MFGIAVIRLPGGGDAFLGEAQRARRLTQRQHRLGGTAAIAEIAGHALDQALEHLGGLLDLAALDVDLAATQLVFVAAPALVVFAVRFFALVDVIQGRLFVAASQGVLRQIRVPGEAIQPFRAYGAGNQLPRKVRRQFLSVELDRRLIRLLQLFVGQIG